MTRVSQSIRRVFPKAPPFPASALRFSLGVGRRSGGKPGIRSVISTRRIPAPIIAGACRTPAASGATSILRAAASSARPQPTVCLSAGLRTTSCCTRKTGSAGRFFRCTLSSSGIGTFTPKKDFTGSASITYTVNDNNGATSNTAKITIAVQPYNAPVAVEDRASTKVNTKVDINIVANDTDSDGTIDATTVDLNTGAGGAQKSVTTAQGEFDVNDSGVVTFTPTKDFVGLASIQYTIKDNKGVMSNAAAINVTVVAVPNVAPVISDFEDERDTLFYTMGTPQQFTERFDVQDADDDSLAMAEIGFVTETYASGSDRLVFTDRGNIKGSFDAATGVLTLNGGSRIADYVTAVRSIRYQFTGTGESGLNVKTIYVRVSDGVNFSDVKKRPVKIKFGGVGLDIPTAFTPNNDGANDRWEIQAPMGNSGSDFADAHIRVFDKSGVMVFDANGLGNAWDGTYQGKHLPVDTYYYTIDLKQQQKRYKGIVAILR